MKPEISHPNGFTLVEAVTTAVIVSIISITAVVMYGGYVKDSRQQNVKNLAETAAAAANSYLRKTGNQPTVNDLHLYLPDPDAYTVDIDEDSVYITDEEHELEAAAHY